MPERSVHAALLQQRRARGPPLLRQNDPTLSGIVFTNKGERLLSTGTRIPWVLWNGGTWKRARIQMPSFQNGTWKMQKQDEGEAPNTFLIRISKFRRSVYRYAASLPLTAASDWRRLSPRAACPVTGHNRTCVRRWWFPQKATKICGDDTKFQQRVILVYQRVLAKDILLLSKKCALLGHNSRRRA